MFFLVSNYLAANVVTSVCTFLFGDSSSCNVIVRPRITNGHLLVNKTHLIQSSAGQI